MAASFTIFVNSHRFFPIISAYLDFSNHKGLTGRDIYIDQHLHYLSQSNLGLFIGFGGDNYTDVLNSSYNLIDVGGPTQVLVQSASFHYYFHCLCSTIAS